jgi:hypothetical protein
VDQYSTGLRGNDVRALSVMSTTGAPLGNIAQDRRRTEFIA